MIWKEKGVLPGSHMCFFNPPDSFKQYYYYLHSCGFFHCDKTYDLPCDGGRPPLFMYIIKGVMYLDYEGKSHSIHENEIMLINCYKPQHYYCADDCNFIFFHFDGKDAPFMTDHLIRQNGGPVFALKNYSEIYNKINSPIVKLCYQDQMDDYHLSSLVYSTLCLMQSSNARVITANMEGSGMIAQTINYINQNISDNFTLKDLADHAGLSPHHFARTFKKETGVSPIEYVAQSKINYAQLMLRTTPSTISQIAETLGYSSSASFINAFKSRRGISPQRYRSSTNIFPL